MRRILTYEPPVRVVPEHMKRVPAYVVRMVPKSEVAGVLEKVYPNVPHNRKQWGQVSNHWWGRGKRRRLSGSACI